jgi:hypothetical protein
LKEKQMASPLLINIGSELADYLYSHPDEIPKDLDSNSLWVLCNGFLIDNIENYSFSPYESEFEWKVRFNNSPIEDREFTYLIKYKAYFQGECGITNAKLIN